VKRRERRKSLTSEAEIAEFKRHTQTLDNPQLFYCKKGDHNVAPEQTHLDVSGRRRCNTHKTPTHQHPFGSGTGIAHSHMKTGKSVENLCFFNSRFSLQIVEQLQKENQK